MLLNEHHIINQILQYKSKSTFQALPLNVFGDPMLERSSKCPNSAHVRIYLAENKINRSMSNYILSICWPKGTKFTAVFRKIF